MSIKELSTAAKNAIEYAEVKQRRQAIETAIRMLNEAASAASRAGVKAPAEFMALRNMFDAKDQELFDLDHNLHFAITQSLS